MVHPEETVTTQEVEALLRINEVLRKIHRGLVDAETREDLETSICEAFADSDPYVFAWIGVHDSDSTTVVPHVSAGVEDTYLEDISIPIGNNSDENGPTATAIQTGEIQVMQNIRENPAYEPWREQALDHGFESSAAIPIANDADQYGVLNLYSGRSNAFDDSELELFEELREAIATAITGIDARRELEAQKRKHKQLTERISDAYFAIDSDWTITYWNEQMAQRTGRPADAVMGEDLWTTFPVLQGTTAEAEYRAAMETQEPRSFEQYLPDPYDYWVEVNVHPDEDGLSVLSRDISDRKHREKQRRKREAHLNQAQAIGNLGSWELDLQNDDLAWSDQVYDIFGVPERESLTYETFLEYIHPEDRDYVHREWSAALDGDPYDIEHRIIVDGETRWVRETAELEFDEDGNPVRGIGIVHDITEQKKREQAFQETTNTLEAIIEAAPDAIILLDEALRVEMWNPASERLFGWSKENVLGERAPFVPDEKEAEFQTLIENLDNEDPNQGVETVRKTKDGDRIPVRLSSARVTVDETLTGYVAIIEDISRRKEYERQIETLHDATRRLLDAEDKQAAAELIVEAAEDLLGFSMPSVWYPRDDGTGLELVANSEEHQRLLKNADIPSPIHHHGDSLWEIFEAGETVVHESIPSDDFAAEVPLTSAIMVPLGDSGMICCATQGTTEFSADTETLATILGQNATAVLSNLEREAQLKAQRNNLEVLDQMVRHDIRNDLQVVSGYAEALDGSVDESQQKNVERIRASAETAMELTETARELAEVMLEDGEQREPIPLRSALETQIAEIRATSRTADVKVEGEIPAVSLLATEQISSVFRNVLQNAIQHNDKAAPVVSVSVTEHDEQVAIHVADNGPGIPAERKASIFEKGKKGLESDGTGIGLYLVNTLIENYGGTVQVTDNEPDGAVVTIEVPTID